MNGLMVRMFVACALAPVAVGSTGCNMAGLLTYAVMAEKTRTVKAKYDLKPDALAGKRMVIRVWAGGSLSAALPLSEGGDTASRDVALAVRGAFLAPDCPLNKLQIKSADAVERYIRSRGNPDAIDAADLAKHFQADIVLDISLEQYTNLAAGSTDLYQAQIQAQIALYDFTKAPGNRVSPEYRAVRTQYPTQPMDVRGSESSNFLIWSQARGKFADKVVKKFHDHEVPLSDPKGEHAEAN